MKEVFDLKNLEFKIARIKKGLTQEELSKTVGLSKQYISRMEMGKAKNPSLKICRMISQILDVDLDEIF